MRIERGTVGGAAPARNRAGKLLLLGAAVVVAVCSASRQRVDAQQAAAGAAGAAPHQAIVGRYCLTCHSERTHSGNLVLERLDLAHVGDNPDIWEKVVHKLRMQAMPPPGMPRPEPASYDAIVSYLETELDRAAAGRVEPGRTDALHRLNATEYRNAIRDLLALDLDTSSQLPPDTAAGMGFDNMAGVLTLSPSLMERYLSAARTVSRLAVGLPSIPRTIASYSVPLDAAQKDRMSDDLPLGSRGGLAVRHQFPVDGEYAIRVRLQKNYVDYVRGLLYPHQLQIRLDGRLLKQFTVGGGWDPKDSAPATFAGNINGNQDWENWAHHADEMLEIRVPVRAGSRVLGVTFPREYWEAEGIVQGAQSGFSLGVNEMPDDNPGVARVLIEGPMSVSAPGESASRQRIFVCQPPRQAAKAAEDACAKRILSTLARRAFRRPVSDVDLRPFLAFYSSKRASGASFDAGIQFALEGLLSHPQFILRVEHDPRGVASGTAYRLTDLELASRLSFFLWSSIPDDELLQVAEQGRLKDPATLERQVRRMISDPKSDALVDNFVGQWLLVRNVRGWIPDAQVYPDFDDNLRQAFAQETKLFIGHQLRDDRSVLELLTARYTFLNERLARHYGIPGVYGSHFRQVELTDTQVRGGILGQGSVLMVTSYPDRTSPVLRGKWILSNLLGSPPNPPPADVTPLPERGEGGRPASVRERLEMHRKNPVCATCHAPMDPLGFALENFDAVGGWQTRSAGKPIDSVGVLPSGVKFEGMAGLREVLLTNYREQIVRTLSEKMLEYALGRELKSYDQPVLRRITREASAQDYTWSSIILHIVESTPFQMRRSAS